GCATPAGIAYVFTLDQVVRPQDRGDRFGPQESVAADVGHNNQYVDDVVKIDWLLTENDIAFRIWNQTDHSMGYLSEVVVPADDVLWTRYGWVRLAHTMKPTREGGGGGEKVGYPPRTPKDSEKESVIEAPLVGDEIQIVLPIEIRGVVNDYVFTFRISGVKQR
ncbi:MAG: hypothetical protein ACE5EO_12950, partial [Candidatus Krumholzibacteriia bacterium]